ncbi:hypothetical protein AAW52_04400 [Vibrio diabolicus]|nr:hypothetical protein AAW52_04400 [Vibrio diabolicus]
MKMYVRSVKQRNVPLQAKRDNSDRKQIRFGSFHEMIKKARAYSPLAEWLKSSWTEKLERERKMTSPDMG